MEENAPCPLLPSSSPQCTVIDVKSVTRTDGYILHLIDMYALVCSFLIPPPKFKYLRNICKTKNKDQVATIGKYSKQVKVMNKSPTQIPIQVIAVKVKQKYLFKMQNLLCGIFRYFVLTDSFANTFKKGHVLMRRSYRRGVSIQTIQYIQVLQKKLQIYNNEPVFLVLPV